MFELIKAGGLLMWPIMLCSVIAMAIIGERLWSLRQKKIAPKNLVALVWQWQNAGHLDKKRINNLRKAGKSGYFSNKPPNSAQIFSCPDLPACYQEINSNKMLPEYFKNLNILTFL